MSRKCASVMNFFRTIDDFPDQRTNLAQLESLTQTARLRGSRRAGTFPRRIPVVVHVLFQDEADNIPDDQIRSQIEVLNEDFNVANQDFGLIPEPFRVFAGTAGLEFFLAVVGPGGETTDGITRTPTQKGSFGVDDQMKSVAAGGTSPWDTSRYMNIWVCQLSNDVLGYAQFPGGNPATDGVVITTQAFGRGPDFRLLPSFNLGRTASHEVGHYLNLFHIWGNSILPNCVDSDDVADTPNQFGPNTGTPDFPSHSCGSTGHGDMFMNFMDYVDDGAMFMFTQEQVERMHAALEFSRTKLGDLPDAPLVAGADGPVRDMVSS
jgi:hypothetical protein